MRFGTFWDKYRVTLKEIESDLFAAANCCAFVQELAPQLSQPCPWGASPT